ncbi:MAG: choline-sulfatase [Gammaproteobacteria bacterium]|nr:choline-sulfatase [Gammaproteobacteria bacterium]
MSANKNNNILIIMADQLTALALGCYGNDEVQSPNIDKLAKNGVTFESAYSSSPLCTPARYAFMTGQNTSNSGGYDNAAYMPSTMPTFAHYMRLMGYQTCLSGKMHFVGADQLHGFEERVTTDIYPADFGWIPDWTNADERIDLWYHNMSSVKQAGIASITNQLTYDDEVGAQSIKAIYEHARGEDERPLCLVSSFIHPHDPYATRRKFWDLYENTDIKLPSVTRPAEEDQDPHNRRLEKVIALDAVDVSDQEIVNARRAYYGNVSYVDEWVGRLQETLEECGMAENTTIIFTSDHGDMLGEFGLWYKMSFREWSCRIPMIIHNPSRFSPTRIPQPVAQVDVLPTLIDIAHEGSGVEKPVYIDPIDGRSMVPLCDGDAESDPNRAVSEYLAEGTGDPMLMIREGNYKYICCSSDPEQLFDLDSDPNETVNLANAPSCQPQMNDFRAQAGAHWDEEAVKEQVIHDQQRRRAVHAALRVGRYQGWDYDVKRDSANEYTRSHMDLTRFDITSRYPRPPRFNPRWK